MQNKYLIRAPRLNRNEVILPDGKAIPCIKWGRDINDNIGDSRVNIEDAGRYLGKNYHLEGRLSTNKILSCMKNDLPPPKKKRLKNLQLIS